MKHKIKSFGIYLALTLMDISDFFIGLCPLTKTGFWFGNKFRSIEALAHWLYGISYNNSEEEYNDAINMGFEDDWKCYTNNQLRIMKGKGLITIN